MNTVQSYYLQVRVGRFPMALSGAVIWLSSTVILNSHTHFVGLLSSACTVSDVVFTCKLIITRKRKCPIRFLVQCVAFISKILTIRSRIQCTPVYNMQFCCNAKNYNPVVNCHSWGDKSSASVQSAAVLDRYVGQQSSSLFIQHSSRQCPCAAICSEIWSCRHVTVVVASMSGSMITSHLSSDWDICMSRVCSIHTLRWRSKNEIQFTGNCGAGREFDCISEANICLQQH